MMLDRSASPIPDAKLSRRGFLVTGAAGQICYGLLFRIAAGEMLGKDQPVILQLIDIAPSMKAVEGVMMELADCAFPTLAGMEASDDPNKGFAGTQVALLVGAMPRGPGMERKDLLEKNGGIFIGQGKALSAVADRDVKVLVVGNPANTNAFIAMNNAKDLPRENFTAMVRLDQNRAMSGIAAKLGVPVSDVQNMTIWGNHSATQYPDVYSAKVGGKSVSSLINDQEWVEKTFIPEVQQRGAAIIKARGLSSAASAANAAIDHIRDWWHGTAPGETVVFAWIVYPSREARDRINAAVMADPRMLPMQSADAALPFDCKRMAYGGFRVLVEC